PEQMQNAKDVDARADIWAVGVVLYELVTARPAFTAGSLPELFYKVTRDEPDPVRLHRPDAPEAIDLAIQRCLRKKKHERFADVRELAEALRSVASPKSEAYLTALSSFSTPVSPTRKLRPSQHETLRDPDWSSRPTRKGRPWPTDHLPLSGWSLRSLGAGL